MKNLEEWKKQIKEQIDESQEEIDEGSYSGDYDVFCFMKQSYEFVVQLQTEKQWMAVHVECVLGSDWRSIMAQELIEEALKENEYVDQNHRSNKANTRQDNTI